MGFTRLTTTGPRVSRRRAARRPERRERAAPEYDDVRSRESPARVGGRGFRALVPRLPVPPLRHPAGPHARPVRRAGAGRHRDLRESHRNGKNPERALLVAPLARGTPRLGRAASLPRDVASRDSPPSPRGVPIGASEGANFLNATRAATPSTAPRIHPRPSTARPANAAHDLVHDIIPRRPSLVLAVGSSRRAGARRRGTVRRRRGRRRRRRRARLAPRVRTR